MAQGIWEDELAEMGKVQDSDRWRDCGLLVCLVCDSDTLVDALLKQTGLRRAICCCGNVWDEACRRFFRTFYRALGNRHPVRECFEQAKAAVATDASRGMQVQAEQFLWREKSEERGPGAEAVADIPEPSRVPGKPAPWPQWPTWGAMTHFSGIDRFVKMTQTAEHFQDRRYRSVLFWGEEGVGKTALCWEFGRHFSTPGRHLFSTGGPFWLERDKLCEKGVATIKDRFAQEMLKEFEVRLIRAGDAQGVRSMRELIRAEPASWDDFLRFAPQWNQSRGWLLVIDGLHFGGPSDAPLSEGAEEEELARLVSEVMSQCGELRLLLTARSQPRCSSWIQLGPSQVMTVKLDPMKPEESAQLFVRSCVKRNLYQHDFDPVALQLLQSSGTTGGDDGGGPDALNVEQSEKLLQSSPLLHALGNNPGRIVKAAAQVDRFLPSLLNHPALPASWMQSKAAAAGVGESESGGPGESQGEGGG